MVDPVTNAATNAAADAGKTVLAESGGFISNLFSSLFKFPVGAVKGVFSNTLGNLFGTLMTGGIFAGIVKFAPTFLDWIPLKIGGKRLSEIVNDSEKEDGTAGLLKTSALAALVINGGIGALKGGAGAVASSTEASGTGGKVGGFLGSAAIVTTLGVLAVQAMNKQDIGFAGAADHASNKQPDVTPPKTDNSKVIG